MSGDDASPVVAGRTGATDTASVTRDGGATRTAPASRDGSDIIPGERRRSAVRTAAAVGSGRSARRCWWIRGSSGGRPASATPSRAETRSSVSTSKGWATVTEGSSRSCISGASQPCLTMLPAPSTTSLSPSAKSRATFHTLSTSARPPRGILINLSAAWSNRAPRPSAACGADPSSTTITSSSAAPECARRSRTVRSASDARSRATTISSWTAVGWTCVDGVGGTGRCSSRCSGQGQASVPIGVGAAGERAPGGAVRLRPRQSLYQRLDAGIAPGAAKLWRLAAVVEERMGAEPSRESHGDDVASRLELAGELEAAKRTVELGVHEPGVEKPPCSTVDGVWPAHSGQCRTQSTAMLCGRSVPLRRNRSS